MQWVISVVIGDMSSGTEDELRQREEMTLRGIRARRREMRLALAVKQKRDAAEKRRLAALATQPELKHALIHEAKEAERTARRLQEGEIGFLDALGITQEEPSDDRD